MNTKAKRIVKHRAGQAAARKLRAAAEGLHRYLSACFHCADGSGSRGHDDSRVLLIHSMLEYAGHLESVHREEPKE